MILRYSNSCSAIIHTINEHYFMKKSQRWNKIYLTWHPRKMISVIVKDWWYSINHSPRFSIDNCIEWYGITTSAANRLTTKYCACNSLQKKDWQLQAGLIYWYGDSKNVASMVYREGGYICWQAFTFWNSFKNVLIYWILPKREPLS